MERVPAEVVLDWLVARTEPAPADPEFDLLVRELTSGLARKSGAAGWDDVLWILHAMRETDELPADITWARADQARRMSAWRRWLSGSGRLPQILDEYLDWVALDETARVRIETLFVAGHGFLGVTLAGG